MDTYLPLTVFEKLERFSLFSFVYGNLSSVFAGFCKTCNQLDFFKLRKFAQNNTLSISLFS